MHPFYGITRDWLAAAANKDLDLIIQVFEHDNSDALAHLFSSLAGDYEVKVFDIEYQPNVVADPLAWLHWILHWYGEHFGEDYIESLLHGAVYGLQYQVFLAWYRQQDYYRIEPLLYEEAGYEANEFFLSLGRILNRLAQKQPFVLLIKHLDCAPSHVIAAINHLLDQSNERQRWGAIGFIEHSHKIAPVPTNSLWHDCLRRLERQGLIMPLPPLPQQASFNWARPRVKRSFAEQHRMLLSAVDMFCFDDVVRMVEQIRHRYNDQHNGQLLFISAFSSFMQRRIDDAVRDFTKVQNCLQATHDQSLLTSSYFWQSLCYALKSQEKLARGAQEQCEKLALEYSDQRGYVLSQLAEFFINANLAQAQVTQSTLATLRFLLSELGFQNILALIQSHVYSQSQRFDRISSRTYLRHCVAAMRTARDNTNKLAFSRALHAMGLVYLRMGNIKQAHRLYELSLSIIERYQNSVDIVPMLNGLGYFLAGQEEWQQAWLVFDRAMGLAIKHRNFNDGSATLFNFAWLYTLTGNVQQALDAVNDLLELLRIRNVSSVQVNNLKDLYLFKGWLHTLLRQPIQARYCLIQLAQFKALKAAPFSAVLEHIIEAKIQLFDHNFDACRPALTAAKQLLDRSQDIDVYRQIALQLELARLYQELGEPDPAQQLFALLRSTAHELNLQTLVQRISEAAQQCATQSEIPVAHISQSYHVLLDLAQKEIQLGQMQQELSDIHQINLLVEMSAGEPNMKSFLRQTIEVMDRRVPAGEFGVLIESDDQTEQALALFLTNDVEPVTKQLWREWLIDKPRVPQTLYHDRSYINAWPMMMGTVETSWLIVAGDDHQHQVWNVTFLQLVAQQLGLIMDRRLREAYLEHRNKTDLLTGVLNRAGLFERLKKQFSLMQREPKQPFSLCYFDLDHFKYFNDQFGHELGDSVLQELVKSVTGQLRGTDELGRVGGDEFIILLRDTDQYAAEHLLERLRATIAEPDWWLPLLADKAAGEKNPVPKEEWISASFGVVVVPGWPADAISRIDLIAQGDAAMYEAKNTGRNCVVIKEFVQNQDTKPDTME